MSTKPYVIPTVEDAANPATSVERLYELARYRGEIGRAVALNPNAPAHLLIWLAKRFPEEVLRNPVMPLLMLEDPGLPLQLPPKLLREILRDWEPPGEFLHPLKRHPDPEIREAARLHVANPTAPEAEPVVPQIEIKGGPALVELLELGGAPGWLLQTALECAQANVRARALVIACKGPDKVLHARVNLLRSAGAGGWLNQVSKGEKDLKPEALAELAQGGPYARKLAAHHLNTPPEVLEALGQRLDEPMLRKLVARNPGTPVSCLLSFVYSSDPVVRKAVAANRRMSPATLDQMSVDVDAHVRFAVAANPATPASTLSRMAVDADPEVRRAVAANRSTDLPTMERLVKDAAERVRRSLAKKRGCPETIVRMLLNDPENYVVMVASQNRSLPGDRDENLRRYWLKEGRKAGRKASANEKPTEEEEAVFQKLEILRNHELDGAVLAEMANDAVLEVRKAVARHGQTPPAVLDRLASDAEPGVRASVVANTNTLAATLCRLMDDPVDSVRTYLGNHRNLPLAWIEKLALDPDEEVRARVAFNRSAPAELRLRMAREDASEKVHAALLNYASENFLPEAAVILAKRCDKCCKELEHNPKLPPEAMEIVLSKIHQYSRHQFLWSNAYHLNDPGPYKSQPIPPELLLKLVHVEDDKYLITTHGLMADVAGYPAVTPEVLETMANELFAEKLRPYRGSMNGRIVVALKAIAKNKKTPPHILEKLLVHDAPQVRLAALDNPSTPAQQKAGRIGNVLEAASTSSSVALRLCALSHPATAKATLRRAAWHGRWAERYAVTQNPAAPRDVLAGLTEDSNRAVSEAARKVLRERFPDAFMNVAVPEPKP